MRDNYEKILINIDKRVNKRLEILKSKTGITKSQLIELGSDILITICDSDETIKKEAIKILYEKYSDSMLHFLSEEKNNNEFLSCYEKAVNGFIELDRLLEQKKL